MTKLHAVLYTKPHCMPCKMTTKLLDSLGMPYENTYYGNSEQTNSIELDSKDIAKREWSEQKVEKLKAKYQITSLPLIKIIDDETEKVLDVWSGFVPDKIKFWNLNIHIRILNHRAIFLMKLMRKAVLTVISAIWKESSQTRGLIE